MTILDNNIPEEVLSLLKKKKKLADMFREEN